MQLDARLEGALLLDVAVRVAVDVDMPALEAVRPCDTPRT